MSSYVEIASSGVVRLAGQMTGGPSNTVAQTGISYVTAGGSDTNDGSSWGAAKATVQAAINVLPVAADGISRNGLVEIGAGTFTVASGTSRNDTGCGLTLNSATVTDASITTADVGAYITGATGEIPPYAYIVSVVAGVSFVMSQVAVATGSNKTVSIVKPGIAVPPGVTLRGRATMNGLLSGLSANYPTRIVDAGTGVTILAPMGSGPGNSGTSRSAVTFALSCLSVTGSASNTYGLYAINLWGIYIDQCEFRSHGQWGIYLDSNAIVHLQISNSECRDNGTVGAVVATGGVFVSGNPNVGLFTNFRSMFNNGFAVYGGVGCAFVGCELQYSATTSFSGSGVGLLCTAGAGNGTTLLAHCWFEGNKGTYQVLTSDGAITVTSCMFQGGSVTNYAVGLLADTQQVILDGCYFQGHTIASLKFTAAGSGGAFSWRACQTTDPLFAKSFSGSGSDIAATLAPASGARNSTAVLMGLPTADPHVIGQLWANSNVVTVSTG